MVTSAVSSAKKNWLVVHPVGICFHVLLNVSRLTSSKRTVMRTVKRKGDNVHPCLIPVDCVLVVDFG